MFYVLEPGSGLSVVWNRWFGSGVNRVNIAPTDLTAESYVYVSTSSKWSSIQLRLLISVAVFGGLGGLLTAVAGGRVRGLVRILLRTVLCTGAAIFGSVILFFGLYIAVPLGVAISGRSLALAGMTIGAIAAGLLGGSMASLIGFERGRPRPLSAAL